MNNKLVSAIIPTHKTFPSSLERIIDSVLAQSYDNIEFKVVYNNASDDI